MTTGQILLAIITGLIVNECCDVSPWLARKLVRWSAHRRYAPPVCADLRAEELAAYIDDRPGRLFKLITALGFVAAAIVTRKVAPGVIPPTPLWWPITPVVPIHYKDGEYEYAANFSHPQGCEMCQVRHQLEDEVREAARKVGLRSRSWKRCIKELRRITKDERWTLVARNLDTLKEIDTSRRTSALVMERGILCGWRIPTDPTVMRYRAAAEATRAEMHRLTKDFLSALR